MNAPKTKICVSIGVETRSVRIVASAREAFDWLATTNTATTSMSAQIRCVVVRVGARTWWAASVVSVVTDSFRSGATVKVRFFISKQKCC